MVGIICLPLVQIGLIDLPKSGTTPLHWIYLSTNIKNITQRKISLSLIRKGPCQIKMALNKVACINRTNILYPRLQFLVESIKSLNLNLLSNSKMF